ncbi:pyruvate kinase [Alkalibaculum sp. M08DMB]|uniref:Pyruvate kinase n=1 Tax=Alkalibaculum sporogenes TaxID=2655001 RepID=A0A6A7KA90_9FIRM|nr:pyruvate kinase [Alkalibaculum sporogenes]MPW26354.1 pyruvate kinase [Alkalibaculum sporogenes]
MKKTKVVCTLGPSSDSEELITKLIESGMNVARINFSHGIHSEHKKKIDLIKKVRKKLNVPIAIMLDTKGPEVRIKQFENGVINLEKNDQFILTTEEIIGNEKKVAITYDKLPQELKIGDAILADDGLLQFVVDDINGNDIICNVENGGELKNNKSLNFPDTAIKLPAITEKDIDDIVFGIKEDIDYIAASFIRKTDDVIEIRRILEENNGEHIQIISKIENREGVDNIDSIIDISDGIMVARGDLGVEISPEEVPLVQKEIIKKCNVLGKPVITATQMLDSMIRNPRPTRAEVTDVANAIFDGTDAIMLSGETAAGKYAIESVETMVRIAIKTETSSEYRRLMTHHFSGDTSVTNVISHATCSTAEQLKASAIITVTSSGYTARMASKFRPTSPIIALTDDERVVRLLSLVWGIQCVETDCFNDTDSMFKKSILTVVNQGLVNLGDLVVISAGLPLGVKGATNMIKVQTIGDVIIRGAGIGKQAATGVARIIDQNKNDKFEKGDIVVTYGVDRDNISYVKEASGVITEEAGLTSQGAIAALQFGIPIVVGAKECLKLIEDGTIVTIDPQRGLIYNGKATVM